MSLKGLLLAAALLLNGCYTLKQGYYQGKLLMSRRPVDEVLADQSTAPKTVERLTFVKSVLDFAKAEGLNTQHSYRSYVQTPGRSVSYLVQAAPKDELRLKRWWFPIVGSMPYLGFFHEEDRDELASELKEDGYDVVSSGVGAFSSLGWFADPIYSSMLRRQKASLAHLFFHELTHRTLWIPDNVTFNENLAEYIGVRLTKQFLATRGDKRAVKQYMNRRADTRLFKAWIKAMRAELKLLYSRNDQTLEQLLKAREEVFARFLTEKWPAFKSERYSYLKRLQWNNAVVLSYSLYLPETDRFEQAYGCSGAKSVGAFLKALEIEIENKDDPMQALEGLCSNK